MAELTIKRHSPLADLARELREQAVTGERHVRIVESPFTTMVSVRLDPSSPAAADLEQALGTTLPRATGEVGDHGQHSALWLGPDEWLVVSQAAPDALVTRLVESVAGTHAAVVDVSSNRTVLELRGASAREVLQKGCPLDLHPRVFGPGRAVTTTLARIPLLLWQVGPDSYRLLPRASFADYVARWLMDACQEFASDFRDAGHSA